MNPIARSNTQTLIKLGALIGIFVLALIAFGGTRRIAPVVHAGAGLQGPSPTPTPRPCPSPVLNPPPVTISSIPPADVCFSVPNPPGILPHASRGGKLSSYALMS